MVRLLSPYSAISGACYWDVHFLISSISITRQIVLRIGLLSFLYSGGDAWSDASLLLISFENIFFKKSLGMYRCLNCNICASYLEKKNLKQPWPAWKIACQPQNLKSTWILYFVLFYFTCGQVASLLFFFFFFKHAIFWFWDLVSLDIFMLEQCRGNGAIMLHTPLFRKKKKKTLYIYILVRTLSLSKCSP